MSYLKEILIIVLSLMIGTSYSAIMTILMNRTDKPRIRSIFYSIGIHTLLIILLTILLLIILFQ